MKYKSSPSKPLGILALSLAVVSQVWVLEASVLEASAQKAVSVDEATSSDPFGDSPNAPAATETAPTSARAIPLAAPASTLHASPQADITQPTSSSMPSGASAATAPAGATARTSTPLTIPAPSGHPGEEYGPPNYLKVWKNPFGASGGGAQVKSGDDGDLMSLIKPAKRVTPFSSWSERRAVASKLYLPERILIGDSSKFTVKGPPNWRVAIAMADKDEGAKPINNHKVRLGPDRKVVAIGKIPPTGVLDLYVATPIQGDLIGTYLFFEAAIWSKDDLSDTQLAETVPPVISNNPNGNGVQIATLKEKKRGLRIVPSGTIPSQSNAASLSTVGQP